MDGFEVRIVDIQNATRSEASVRALLQRVHDSITVRGGGAWLQRYPNLTMHYEWWTGNNRGSIDLAFVPMPQPHTQGVDGDHVQAYSQGNQQVGAAKRWNRETTPTSDAEATDIKHGYDCTPAPASVAMSGAFAFQGNEGADVVDFVLIYSILARGYLRAQNLQ